MPNVSSRRQFTQFSCNPHRFFIGQAIDTSHGRLLFGDTVIFEFIDHFLTIQKIEDTLPISV